MSRLAADKDLLIVRVAELYYEEGKTQDEIGALLDLSRFKVGRLLSQARADGIVRIEIVHPRARRLGLERQLVAVKDCRAVAKADMVNNDALPAIDVDPETFAITIEGELVTPSPATSLPLAQLYSMF